MCSSAPDMDGLAEAAAAQAEVAKEALAFYKDEYAKSAGTRKRATDTALKVGDAQLATMTQQNALAKEYADYNRNTFRPLEQRMVSDAEGYDTDARRGAAASEAAADVQAASSNQQQILSRSLSRAGVNPASGQAYARMQDNALATAAMSAGAQNNARRQVEATGWARRADAANLGRNLPSAQATAVQTGVGAGNAATGNMSAALQAQTSGAALMGQGYGTAIQANGSAGNLYGQQAQIQAQSGGGFTDAVGAVAGLGMAAGGMGWKPFGSDERIKENRAPANDEAALAAVEATPVETWDYKPGHGDGGSHVGPMAQQVAATMGQQAAPGGTTIDPINTVGVTMSAVRALAKKVRKLEGSAA
jgi:hypothetical protein